MSVVCRMGRGGATFVNVKRSSVVEMSNNFGLNGVVAGRSRRSVEAGGDVREAPVPYVSDTIFK